MKIQGKELKTRNREPIVIERQDQRFYFIAEAIVSYEEFDKLVPLPEAPMKMLPGGVQEKDLKNEEFRQRVLDYGALKTHWFVITSLKTTEGLEWDTVDYDNPDTWGNWATDLQNSGFTAFEIDRLVEGITKANGITTKSIEQAREDFLAGRLPTQE